MRKKSKKVLITERDLDIFNFLDRVGYANLKQIGQGLGDDSEKYLKAILRRLYLLRRFGYLKVFYTHLGNYYALTNPSRMENGLISTIKLDQLHHHDFLIELFLLVRSVADVETEREIRAWKKFGSKGKIPDMIIDDWIIEYERTNKSNIDCKAVVDYWVTEKNRKLCIIYEKEEIRARYQRIDSELLLIDKNSINNILEILKKADIKNPDNHDNQSFLDMFRLRRN